MLLEEKILNDYKDALKKKDAPRSSALSYLRSQLKNIAIDKKKDVLDDNEVVIVIKKQIKKLEDSIEQFKKGMRQDLVEKESAELDLLKSYLPQELAAEELKKIVDETVSALGAVSLKDMGRVMKEVIEKSQGRADNKLVSDLVRAKLSNPAS
ncbi:MAG: GatB/YqeY domain-containing protein [Candidatus Omnitrophota bacterium]|jgi:uncharacterized protein YqeY|nr:MAG: GatB/YqeY domain-containing protein [Candidatus Omnitrophota bacterium]